MLVRKRFVLPTFMRRRASIRATISKSKKDGCEKIYLDWNNLSDVCKRENHFQNLMKFKASLHNERHAFEFVFIAHAINDFLAKMDSKGF